MGTPYELRVTRGQGVRPGECLAASDVTSLHAPLAGRVAAVEDDALFIACHDDESWTRNTEGTYRGPGASDNYAAFLAAIGLVGMGGSLFPASIKLRLSSAVDTVVVNGVECEPGVTIDRTLLLAEHELVQAGAEATAEAVGASRIVLAVRKDTQFAERLRGLYPFDILPLRSTYPAGAERLILRRLAGRMPVAGELPFHMGYVVQNVASLRAVGRAVRDGVPVVERPLSLVIPGTGEDRNLLVPVGMSFADLLTAGGHTFDPNTETLVAGGTMMGQHVRPDQVVTKGTNSLFVLQTSEFRARERTCIRCGACCDVCPLDLHPVRLAEAMTEGERLSGGARVQLDECLLCGACAVVCPSRIPLVSRIRAWRIEAHGMNSQV